MRAARNILILLPVLLHFSGISQKQTMPPIRPVLSTDTIYIGEPVNYQIFFPVDRSYDISALKFHFPGSNPKIELLSEKGITIGNGKDYFEAGITSYDTGKIEVPPIAIPPSLYISGTAFYVKATTIDSSGEYRDIKPIIESAKTGFNYWYLIASIAGLLLLVLILWYFAKKKKSTYTAPEPLNRLSPLQEALQQLQQLAEAGLPEQNPKSYFGALDGILKRYCYRKGLVKPASITNQELKLAMQKIMPASEQKSNLLQTLQLSSYAQYAKYRPENSIARTALLHYQQSILSLENNEHAV